MNSETYHYKKGANQLFSQTSHIFDPTLYTEEDLMYNADREVFIYTIFFLILKINLISFLHKNKIYFLNLIDYSNSYTLCS